MHFAPAVKCAASPSVIRQGQGLVFFGSHVGSEVVLCLSLTGVSGGGTTQLSELMDRELRRGLGHLKHHRMTLGPLHVTLSSNEKVLSVFCLQHPCEHKVGLPSPFPTLLSHLSIQLSVNHPPVSIVSITSLLPCVSSLLTLFLSSLSLSISIFQGPIGDSRAHPFNRWCPECKSVPSTRMKSLARPHTCTPVTLRRRRREALKFQANLGKSLKQKQPQNRPGWAPLFVVLFFKAVTQV